MKKTILFLLISIAFIGCKNADKKEQSTPIETEITEKPKVDTCLFVNGRSYSNIQQKCVELDSLPVKLNPLKDGMMVKGSPAYLLFDETKSKAELFFPENDKGTIFEKSNTGNWTHNKYILIAWKGYVLKQNDTPIYGGQ